MIRRLVYTTALLAAAALPAQTAAKPVARYDSLFVLDTLKASQFYLGPLVTLKPDQTLTIVLTTYQQKQLAAYQATVQSLEAQRQAFLSGIIGAWKDPGTIGDWKVTLTDSAIVLTPPAKDSTATQAKKPGGVIVKSLPH